MPIDKILEQVAEDERDADKNKPKTDLLAEGAESVLQNYLIQYFQGGLPGQQFAIELDSNTIKSIKILGTDSFIIHPTKSKYDRYLKPSFLNIENGTDIEKLIRKMYGEEALHTDIYSFVDGSNPKKIEDVLPEFRSVNLKLINCDIKTLVEKTTLHPQLVALSLDPIERPLVVLTMERSLNKGNIDLKDCKYWSSLSTEKKHNLLDQFLPSTIAFLETAETYNYKTFLTNIMALENAIEEYKKFFR